MSVLTSSAASWAGFKLVDLMPVFPDTSSQHLASLAQALAGHDHNHIYINFLSQHSARTAFFYGLPLASGIVAGAFAWSYFGRKFDPLFHVSGRKKKLGKEAAKAARIATANKLKFSGLGIKIHPDLQLTRGQETESMMFAAAQGGGKTTLINHTGHQVIKRGDKVIIYDLVKCDYTKTIPNDINGNRPIIIAPWFYRTSKYICWWDVAKDIKKPSDAKAFAVGLIPLSGGENPMWCLAARGILVSIFRKLIVEKGENWNFDDLKDLCYLELIDLKDIAAQYYPPALSSVADAESKTSQSVMINLHAFMQPIFDLWECWSKADPRRGFSFVNWFYDDDAKFRTLILQGNLEQSELSAGYIRAITELLINKMASPSFSESQKRRIWFILDELKQLGKIESLVKLMEVGRSRGICTIIAFQSIFQLREVYGEDAMKIYQAITGLKFFGRIVGTSEQEFVCSTIGKRTVQRRNISQSGTGNGQVNTSSGWSAREDIDVFHPSELEELGPIAYGKSSDFDKKFVKALVVGHGKDALVMEWPLFKTTEYRNEQGVPISLINAKPITTKVMAQPTASEAEHPPSAGRVPPDTRPLEILPAEPVQPQVYPEEAQETEEPAKTTILDMFSNQPSVPIEAIYNDDAIQEIAGTVASSAMTQAAAEAVGIPSTALDIIQNLAELDYQKEPESTSIVVIGSQKKKQRKQRKYSYEN